MMKTFKTTISILLALIITVSAFVTAFATEPGSERLYNVYGDNMLFQQKKDAVIAGTGTPGKSISCKLFNSVGAEIKSANGVVENDGTFKLSFVATDGSFEEYTVEVYSDGDKFAEIKNVVFGELWLSGGQSNMQLEMRYSETGKQMLKSGERGSKNVRYFYSAPTPAYKGDISGLPYDPQTDIEGCCWFDGTDERIFDMSGVGYFFAEKLSKDLNMPVGLLSGSLGGSSITCWLSRESIESDPAVKSIVSARFISKNKWQELNNTDYASRCFGMYNKKIAPLENFRPAGLIWYQGEADAEWKYGNYTACFDLLQKSWSELFGYGDELMPVIISSLAGCTFGNSTDSFMRASSEYSDMQKKYPDKRAVISISDVPLTYDPLTLTIHPTEKKPVGERMAFSAGGLVYGKTQAYCGPNVKNVQLNENDILITFDYCGDTLKAKGNRIYGFTICGKDGVYLPAEAEIVSPDTVRVFNEKVKNPVSATYANGLSVERCNLYSYENGEYIMPVLPLITDKKYSGNMWLDCGWTDCDCEKIWKCESLNTAGSYEIWNGGEISADAGYKGGAGLKITGNDNVTVSPATSYFDEFEGGERYFINFNKDWRSYKTVSFMVRNDGDKAVRFAGLKLFYSEGKAVTPVVDRKFTADYLIPADGQWHEITLSLNNLKFMNNKIPFVLSRVILDDIKGVQFDFEGEEINVSMDEISFESTGYSHPVFKILSFDPISMLVNLISALIGLIMMNA